MSRGKKYTPKQLQEAIDEYFGSISRVREIYDFVPTGRMTPKGAPEMKAVRVENIFGEPVSVVEFVVPPSLTGLRMQLGISKQTWSEYAKDEKRGPICAEAKATIETYLERLLVENPKAARGIMFNLQANFGWKEKREVGLDEPTRKAMATTMTMDEKLALLSEAAGAFLPEDVDAVAGEDDDAEAVE